MDITKYARKVDMNSYYLGIPRLFLMENAGKEVASYCAKFSSVAVFCGTGNNGGDGFVAARHLSSLGKKVRVYALPGKRTEENQTNLGIIQKLDSIELNFVNDSKDCTRIKKELTRSDAIVDALLGVGIKGEPREPVKSLVETINSSRAFKIAIDVPTPGLKADLTLSLHCKKTGKAKAVNIGIPREAETQCGPGDLYAALPERKGGEHKGDFGRLLVIGGSRDYIGAPALVARAASRTGVDLITLACPNYVAQSMSCEPDMIIKPLDSDFFLGGGDVDTLLEMNYDVLVLGNGIGLREETRSFVNEFLRKNRRPAIIDADALKLLDLRNIRENHTLTPHSKEFEMLFGEYLEDERIALTEKMAKKTGATIILKGPVDVVSNGRETKLNKTGNPGMTVGGTGDVLAGITGALTAKNENFEAACAAAFLSGLAGDKSMEKFGYSFTATDVIDSIPEAIKYCKRFE